MFVKTLAALKLLFVLFLSVWEVVEQDFFVDYVFELFSVEIKLLELELKRRDGLSARLGEGKVPHRLPGGAWPAEGD